MTITYERAHELFEYRDGQLYNKTNRHTRARKGMVAGCIAVSKRKNGTVLKYWRIHVDKKNQFTHRLIFLMHYGYMPVHPCDVDHKDTNSLNNNISNLRVATKSQNQANSYKQKNNTSGFKGVTFNKVTKKWRAEIQINGVKNHLGYFFTAEEAHKKYLEKSHEFFGEFSKG